MMKSLLAYWGAPEKNCLLDLHWVELTRSLWHHVAQSLAGGHPGEESAREDANNS